MPFFFLYNFYKKYFFLLSFIQPLVLEELIPHQRRAWNTVVISYPIILYHIQSWVSSQNYVNYFLLLFTTLYYYFLHDISPLYFCTFHALYIIGRNSLRKCNLDVQNPCLTRHSAVIFLAHFRTLNINLSNYIISHILLLVKLTLCKLFSYIFHNKTFYTSSFFTNISVRSLHIMFIRKDYPPSSPCGVPVT